MTFAFKTSEQLVIWVNNGPTQCGTVTVTFNTKKDLESVTYKLFTGFRVCICIYNILKGIATTEAGLMIMASHQTFSDQNKHLSGQIKFGHTNLLYNINGNFIEFAKDNKRLDNFQSLS